MRQPPLLVAPTEGELGIIAQKCLPLDINQEVEEAIHRHYRARSVSTLLSLGVSSWAWRVFAIEAFIDAWLSVGEKKEEIKSWSLSGSRGESGHDCARVKL